MAEEETAPKPPAGPPPAPKPAPVFTPPAPTAPEPSVAEKAAKSVASAKTGFDPLRPFRYAHAFVSGTLRDGLNGMAKWAQKGLKWGAIAGFLGYLAQATVFQTMGWTAITQLGAMTVAIAGAEMLLPALLIGGIAAAAAGMALGGAYGLVTGGMKAVGRLRRTELYAEDLINRGKIQRDAPPSRTDYRAAHRAHVKSTSENTLWFLEREKEAERDAKASASQSGTYWQDREQNRPSFDRGQGF